MQAVISRQQRRTLFGNRCRKVFNPSYIIQAIPNLLLLQAGFPHRWIWSTAGGRPMFYEWVSLRYRIPIDLKFQLGIFIEIHRARKVPTFVNRQDPLISYHFHRVVVRAHETACQSSDHSRSEERRVGKEETLTRPPIR